MSKKLFHGNCSCRKVTFEVNIDLASATSGKCNCTFCVKRRLFTTRVSPADFTLLTGKNDLTNYEANGSHRMFCKTCGVVTHANLDPSEWTPESVVAVNLGCLEDITVAELKSIPIEYRDGKANTWAPLTDQDEISIL